MPLVEIIAGVPVNVIAIDAIYSDILQAFTLAIVLSLFSLLKA